MDPFCSGWGIEVAYFFQPDHRGHGFATDLVSTSIRQGFKRLNLDSIQAYAHRENISSIRVLEKNGFEFLRYEPELDRNHYLVRRTNKITNG